MSSNYPEKDFVEFYAQSENHHIHGKDSVMGKGEEFYEKKDDKYGKGEFEELDSYGRPVWRTGFLVRLPISCEEPGLILHKKAIDQLLLRDKEYMEKFGTRIKASDRRIPKGTEDDELAQTLWHWEVHFVRRDMADDKMAAIRGKVIKSTKEKLHLSTPRDLHETITLGELVNFRSNCDNIVLEVEKFPLASGDFEFKVENIGNRADWNRIAYYNPNYEKFQPKSQAEDMIRLFKDHIVTIKGYLVIDADPPTRVWTDITGFFLGHDHGYLSFPEFEGLEFEEFGPKLFGEICPKTPIEVRMMPNLRNLRFEDGSYKHDGVVFELRAKDIQGLYPEKLKELNKCPLIQDDMRRTKFRARDTRKYIEVFQVVTGKYSALAIRFGNDGKDGLVYSTLPIRIARRIPLTYSRFVPGTVFMSDVYQSPYTPYHYAHNIADPELFRDQLKKFHENELRRSVKEELLKQGPVIIGSHTPELRQKIIDKFKNEKAPGEKLIDLIESLMERARFEGDADFFYDYDACEHVWFIGLHPSELDKIQEVDSKFGLYYHPLFGLIYDRAYRFCNRSKNDIRLIDVTDTNTIAPLETINQIGGEWTIGSQPIKPQPSVRSIGKAFGIVIGYRPDHGYTLLYSNAQPYYDIRIPENDEELFAIGSVVEFKAIYVDRNKYFSVVWARLFRPLPILTATMPSFRLAEERYAFKVKLQRVEICDGFKVWYNPFLGYVEDPDHRIPTEPLNDEHFYANMTANSSHEWEKIELDQILKIMTSRPQMPKKGKTHKTDKLKMDKKNQTTPAHKQKTYWKYVEKVDPDVSYQSNFCVVDPYPEDPDYDPITNVNIIYNSKDYEKERLKMRPRRKPQKIIEKEYSLPEWFEPVAEDIVIQAEDEEIEWSKWFAFEKKETV